MKRLGKLAATLFAALLLVACKGVENKVNVTVDGPGEVTADGFTCSDQCDASLPQSWLQAQLLTQKAITFSAAPQSGYELFGWISANDYVRCSTSSQCKVSVQAGCGDPLDFRGSGVPCSELQPDMKFVSAVFVQQGTTALSVWDYEDRACLITTSDQIRCWGYPEIVNNIPTVVNPTDLQLKGSLACVLDDSGLQCWGSQYYLGEPPALLSPSAFTVSNQFICAIDQGQVACWGYSKEWVQNIPTLNNPTRITSDYRNACVIDNDGLHCWGLNANPVQSAPLGEDPIIRFENIDCEITDTIFRCESHY